MIKCELCNKLFISNSKLLNHKNNKKPCNRKREPTECKLCNIKFQCPAKLRNHKQTKKHNNIEKQYIIDNSINIINNININYINLTIVTTFSETNIDVIELKDIERLLMYEDKIQKFINEFNKFPDEIYGNSQYLVLIFKFFIKIFAKLNFNLAYSENHNCIIYSFNKSDSKFIEYQILEINNTHFNYEKKCIDYELFIKQFINLMTRVNNKFQNNEFDYILKYVNRYNKLLFTSDTTKLEIENELLTQYTAFEKSKNSLKTEDEIFKKDLALARANAFKNIITFNKK